MAFPTIRVAALGLACSLVLASVGCGDGDDDSTPVACLDGPGAYVGALGDAPGEVKLSGEVPISDCLTQNQGGGDLATVGAAMVAAATELNGAAREDPGGSANLQLGYLIGAAERGAAETEGIHADLSRRLEVAARYTGGDKPLPPAFDRAYREGLEAGRENG